MRPAISLTLAKTEADLADIRRLFRAYTDWLGIDLSYQGFEEELAALPGKYATPEGALFLARNSDGEAVGCIAMRPLDEAGICEMKRLYVCPEGRGLGVGRKLVAAIIEAAKMAGYQKMRLDTLPTMKGALTLYKEAGFREIPAYYETPVPNTIFMELRLSA